MSGAYVQALALRLDPTWRRLTAEQRTTSAHDLNDALSGISDVDTFTYSMIGLQPNTDFLVWRLAPTFEALEESAALLLRTGMGQWCTVQESFVGLIQPSQYTKKPTEQEQSLFAGDRSKYLIVYPFTKSTEWYLMSREDRQQIMNGHMRVGHAYKEIRQLLAYSFGLDDQDFLVAYETDELPKFVDLVRALRETESRRSTVRDTPILAAIHRPFLEIARLLGA